jgi:zinc protease
MRNLRIDKEHEFDKEKGAVINELKRDEDNPWDLELKAILPLLFGKDGPYGHPVIGLAEHVRAATPRVIKAHYDKWYHPNNAVLVMAGGFDADDALKAIKELFGPIPRAKLPARRALPAKGALPGKRPARLEMASKFAVTRLLMGFNTVRSGDPEQPALAVLEALLGLGKTSRLYKALVEGGLASSASADSSPGRYPGWFAIQVELLPGKERAAVEKAVLAELGKLRDEKVGDAEMKRVRHLILAGTVFDHESPSRLARTIGEGVTINDLDFVKKYLPRVLAVAPADVRRVARKYLDPDKRVVVWSIPPKKKLNSGRNPLRKDKARKSESREERFSLEKTRRVVLPNGLVLLLFENHRLPIVEAHLAVRDVSLYEPDDKLGVAALTGLMFAEGTARHSTAEIAEMIANVGGVLARRGSSGGSVRVLAPDRELGLGLLLECVTQPAFPKKAFAQKRAALLAAIAEAETQPDEVAQQRFRALAYGKHPFGRPAMGTKKTVAALTPADCADFHKKVFVPNNAILAVVGDFDSEAVIAQVKKSTAGWKKAPLARPKPPEPKKPKGLTQVIISMPEAAQLHIYAGHVGVRRKNPDYYKLLVMDYILGTGEGFTDRLSSRVRDREGLAYTVSANITSEAGTEPGLFTCYVGTDKENFAKVKAIILEELKRIRDTKPTARELADVKAFLTGSRLLAFTTNGGVAEQLLAIERYGLGRNYVEEFRKGVEAVSAADVQAAARKYLDPERLIVVAAGPVDKEGKPLPEGKEKPER